MVEDRGAGAEPTGNGRTGVPNVDSAAAPALSLDDRGNLTLPSGVVRRSEDGMLVLHEDDLAGLAARDLQRVLAWVDAGIDNVRVSTVPAHLFDDEGSPVEPFAFEGFPDRLVIGLEFYQDDYEDDEELALSRIVGLLARLARRHRFRVDQAGPDPYYPYGPPYRWLARLVPTVGSRFMTDLARAAQDAVALLEAASGGTLTRTSTLELLRAGHAEALIGMPEGPWLDVKVQHYDLSRPAGKIALAQAVARLANAEEGGIVVVGMEAKKVPGGEEIRGIRPLPADARVLRRYQAALELHLFPPPDSLDLERVDVDGGMLILLHLPPQPEELKPFLVHGAVVDGRVEGAFISIVRRRGESSIPVTAAAVHAALAAGRALLRRGELPRDPNIG